MDASERCVIEWKCQQLALRFIALTDRQDWVGACALMTEDALFARPTDPDNPLEGRAAIQAAFEARPKERITRHLCTNIVVSAQSETEARGLLYALLYTGGKGEAGLPAPADARQLLGEFEDRYRLTEDGWCIAERRGRLVFSTG